MFLEVSCNVKIVAFSTRYSKHQTKGNAMYLENHATCQFCHAKFPKQWLKHPEKTGACYASGFLPMCSTKCKENHEAKLIQEEVSLVQVALALQT